MTKTTDSVVITLLPDEMLGTTRGERSAWAWLVKRRAGDRCERCGSTEMLESHHLDRDKLNNRLSNGMALCRLCHYEEHAPEGKSKRGAAAVKAMWARLSPEERSVLVARMGRGRSCELGCTCKRHSKPKLEFCARGHRFDEENTYVAPDGGRACRACRVAVERRHYLKIKAARKAEREARS